jgi:pyruvate,water dikinase
MIEKKEGQKEGQKIPKEKQRPDFIKWFSELDKNSGKVAGGKGANLGEMYRFKIPVPPGFVITAQAYDYFIKNAGINEKIKELLGKIEYENTDQLNQTTKEIREHIEKAEFPKEMEEEILEAYETLGAEDSELKARPAHDILKKTPEPIFVAVRSSATTEDLAEASFAGQQDTYLNIKGETELLNSIKKCFASLFTPRATYYRHKKGFRHEQASLAVVIQKMVDADKAGVVFSKDPSSKRDVIIIEAGWGLGEGVVSGKVSPDRYIISEKSGEFKIEEKKIGKKKIAITRTSSGKEETVKLKEEISERQVLKEYEIIKLAEIAIKLEKHYQKPQDIEFAIEKGNICIVQTRPITTLEKRAEVGAGQEITGEVILTGLAASPGVGSGKIKIIRDPKDLGKIKPGDILVTKMTNPDMVVTMQKCAAIVTDEGGLTAHAAIVSREMGIPAVVGTQTATAKLREGELITVNGFTGKIYKGKITETIQKEIRPVTTETKTKLKLIVDLPSFAERAARTKLKSIGLARIEGIIAESGKHPKYFLEKNNMKEYEDIIFNGIDKIAEYFDSIWVRTSDIRTDEFKELEGSPKEKEANPMLGMHGVRYGIKYPEIIRAELRAMKRVAEKGKTIGIMAPQIISVEEVKKLKEFLKEISFLEAEVGIMIETPAAVQIIKELCEEGIDFISFGTNDLTQYTLAIDRGNEQVQGIYNEMHPAILHQIEYVIKTCKGYGVQTSICGQAGSQKEMVKFLVEKGIDSISVNADVAADIADYVSELEEKNRPGVVDLEQKEEEPEEAFVKPEYIRPEEEVEEESEEEISGETAEREEEAEEAEEVEEEPGEIYKEEPEAEPRESTETEEPPKIKGAKPVKDEESSAEKLEERVEELVDEELGIVSEVKENVKKGEEAIEEIVEKIEEKTEKPKEKKEGKKSEKKEDEEEILDIF